MEIADLESLALRAVELEVQGRSDPRLLTVTRARLGGRRRVARLVAAIANTYGTGAALLVFGMRGRTVIGLDEAPDSGFWRGVLRALPGATPTLTATVVRVAGADIAVVHVARPGELVAAWRRHQVEVPFIVDNQLSLSPPPVTTAPASSPDSLPSLGVSAGWIERSLVDDGLITTYRGVVDVELGASAGVMEDRACSATLLVADTTVPIALDVQIHPVTNDAGLRRTPTGLEVRTSFLARLYLAAARTRPIDQELPPVGSAQLVISVLLPGRTVPEVRTLFLSADPGGGERWTTAT